MDGMDKRKKLTVYCDGASRGNPGPAAIGIVIYENDKVIKEISQFLGDSLTNNQAEYLAVIESLKQAAELGASEVIVKLDSELAQKQLLGEYKVKNSLLKELWEQVAELVKKFDEVQIVHVPREENKEADRLANQALDKKLTEKRSVLAS